MRGQRAGRNAKAAASSARRAEGVPQDLLPLVAQIDESGEELKRDPTGSALTRYKTAVHQFLDAAVADSMRVTSESSLGLSQKLFSTIARVNMELTDLADAVLGRQPNVVKTAQIVDQVKGLVVDLYR